MSLSSGLRSFASGWSTGSNIDRQNEARSIARDQNARAEEAAQRTRNYDEISELSGLANDLGISRRAGEEIDIPKLQGLLQKQRDSGKFDPKLERFVTLVGNKDLSVERNPGFSFTNLQVGPQGTLTMQGSYEGDGKQAFATSDRKPGADSPVGFSSVEEVAGLVANQYNQAWNKPGISGMKREVQLKGDILEGDQSIADNQGLIMKAVGELTNELEETILRVGGENAPEIATKLKRALAGKTYPEQLEILQQYGSELKVPVSNIVTPEVQEAAKQESFGVLRSDAKKPEESKSPLQDQNPVIQATAKKGAEASDEDIIQGKVQVTQEEIDALQERLKAKGITTLEELNKATLAEQQSMRAMLSTIAANEDQRKTYLTRMQNVMATGSADYNAQELDAAVLAERTEDRAQQAENRMGQTFMLNLDKHLLAAQKFSQEVGEKLGSRIRDNFKQAGDAIYGVDGDGQRNTSIPKDFDKDRFFSGFGGPTGAFTKMYRDYLNARGGEAKAQTRLALNSMISMGIQALAESEDYGSFSENFLPDGSIDYINGSDIFLERLEIKPDGSLAVIDPATGQQVDETIPASVVKELFGPAYAYVVREIKGGAGSARGKNKTSQAD